MPLSRSNILIVEDQAIIALDLESAVEEANGQVIGAASTIRKALKLLHANEVHASHPRCKSARRGRDARRGSVDRQERSRSSSTRGSLPFPSSFDRYPGLLVFRKPTPSSRLIRELAALLSSNSMDPEEQALQREGFVAAFRSPVVHDAIRKEAHGRIAVTYMEWAGTVTQQVVVPWIIIEDTGAASELANRLAAAPIRRAPRTSISAAIDYSVLLLEGSGVEAARRVIDISGDGANNQGRPVTNARNEAWTGGRHQRSSDPAQTRWLFGHRAPRPLLP